MSFREYIEKQSSLWESYSGEDVLSTSKSRCDLKDCLVTHVKIDNGDRYEIFKIGRSYRVMAFYKGKVRGEELYLADPKERLRDIVTDVQQGYMR